MSNVFPLPSDQNGSKLSGPQAEKIADIIWQSFDLLSVEDQQIVLDRLSSAKRIIPASRAGEVLGKIVRFLPKQKEWTASQIRQKLMEEGTDADQRSIFNAIGYLAKKGSIQRLGGGRYLVDGVGVQSYDDLDDCGR